MNRSARLLGLLLCASVLGPSAARAATLETVGGCDGARLDRGAGVARSLSGCGRADLGLGAVGAARQALGRVAGALGVRRDTRDLGLMSVSRTSAGPRVRFQQFVDGVPVRNGQVAVALDEDGDVVHVGNGAVRPARLAAQPAVPRATAILRARRRVPSGFDTVSAPTARLVAEPRGRALELAWHVVLPVRAPRGDWNVVVSARSGDVLTAFDALRRAEGSALTYSPNPVQQTNDLGLRDGTGAGDTDQSALRAARVPLTLTDLSAGTKLTGTYVDTASTLVEGCEPIGYVPGQATSESRVYEYQRAQNAFEETVAYAAITRVQRDFERLGFPSVFPGPVPINVHCVADDTSFYSTADQALHMGDGGVDDAEDADVIVHELGHATQDAQAPDLDARGEQGAIGEGFGDVLAAYTYLQDGDPAYQSARRFCVMEWDATSYNPATGEDDGSGCQRWVDGTDEDDGSDIGTYDGTPSEVHDDGRYWSAMVTCVFTGIEPALGTAAARDRVLALVLAHNYDLMSTAANGAFADSVAALRAEDQVHFGGAEVELINDCAEQRLGIAPPSDSTPPAVTGAIAPAAPDGANGWYRTAPAVTWIVADVESTAVAAGCQSGTDPADTAGKTVTCTATSSGGVTVKSLSYKKDSTPPSLAGTLRPVTPAVGQRATAAPNATDATSGVASQGCGAPATSSRGTHTVACSATDLAGNRATQTLTYTVAPNPTFKVSRPRVSATGNLSFRLRSSATGRVRVTATSGKVRFRASRATLTAGERRTLRLELSRRARKAFNAKLRGGKRVKVRITVTPALGRKRTLTIRVRRPL